MRRRLRPSRDCRRAGRSDPHRPSMDMLVDGKKIRTQIIYVPVQIDGTCRWGTRLRVLGWGTASCGEQRKEPRMTVLHLLFSTRPSNTADACASYTSVSLSDIWLPTSYWRRWKSGWLTCRIVLSGAARTWSTKHVLDVGVLGLHDGIAKDVL